MYHERQTLQRCLLHAINNLLQEPAWSVQSLNALSDGLQAQRTRFLGSYSADVLISALQQHGLEVKWHDARDTQLASLDLSSRSSSEQQELEGVVLNVAGRGLWSSLTGGRHWLAIACIQGRWWNLDSQLPAPVSFGQPGPTAAAASDDGGAAALRAFLQRQLAGGAHVLLVYRQQQGGVEQGAEPAAAG